MSWPTGWGPQLSVAFCASVGGAVTLSLNDVDASGHGFVVGEGYSFPLPPQRQNVVTNPLRDGGEVTGAVYDLRHLLLPLALAGADQSALGALREALFVELTRTRNYLRLALPGSTTYVYARTFASPGHEVDRWLWVPVEQYQTLDLLAEPFLLSPAVTIDAGTWANDPAASAGTGGYVDISGVVGDVPAPAVLAIRSVAAAAWWVGRRSHGDPTALGNLTLQAEAMTLGTDAAVVADAAMSGGSKVRISFATQTSILFTRIRSTSDFPVSIVEGRGRYRVLAVVAATVVTDSFVLQMNVYDPADTAVMLFGDEVPWLPLAANNRQVVDLGDFAIPHGKDPVTYGDSGESIDTRTLRPAFFSSRVGTGALDVDYLIFLPADESLTVLSTRVHLVAGTEITLDGPRDAEYFRDYTTARYIPSYPITRDGPLPVLAPRQVNRIWLQRENHAGGGPAGHVLADTAEIRATYWARRLSIPGPPPVLAVTSGLDLWIEADSLVLADGAAVSTWDDLSTANNDFTQALTLRPTYRATGGPNGLAAVEFDGVNDEMASAASAATKPFTIIVVTRFTGTAAVLGASVADGVQYNAGSSLNQQGVSVIGAASAPQAANVWAIAAVTYSAAGVWAHYLGTVGANGTGTNNQTFTASTVRLGRGDGVEYLAGKAYAVLRWDRVLTNAELNSAAGDYLGVKTGLAWADV